MPPDISRLKEKLEAAYRALASSPRHSPEHSFLAAQIERLEGILIELADSVGKAA